jgi:YVTN family beta-propeller protein
MKFLNMLIVVLCFLLPSASNAQNELTSKYDKISSAGLAYVCHITHSFVTVIDTKNNNPVGKIICDKGADYICFSPDGNNGYISNFNSNNVTVFDKTSGDIIATVEAGENPTFLLPVQNGKYVIISHQSHDGICILNSSDNTIYKKMDEGTGPLYLLGDKIYQPQIFSPYLYIINVSTFEIIKRVFTGGRPMEMVVVDNKFGYIANYDFDELTKIDIKTDSVVSRIKNVNLPRGIAYDPTRKCILVTDVSGNKLTFVSAEADSVISVIDGFKMPVSIAFTPDYRYAYVANQGSANISVVDEDSKKIVDRIGVADNPIYIYVDDK